ncbi:GATA transcription factor 9 [Striga asiatica]|uniref:GATA transcription factor 9 n=1 Tax=Striga asiatica TaxID=4170 RepID=A0A5A7NW58_STRAF|nr:GATA transcription factor 9 [Striga asiatica]
MAILKFLALYFCLLSILTHIPNPSVAAAVSVDAVARNKIRREKSRGADTNTSTLKNADRVDPKRGCGDMGTRSECGSNPRCRWCRSEALDDTCFSKSEAWRLPSQVFSCEF